jgi:hypothetical protein
MRFPRIPTHRYVRRIGVLPLVLGAGTLLSASSITPYGVNNSGVIVGEYDGGPLPMAFMYNPVTMTYSYFTPPSSTSGAFIGINDSGVISGSYTTSFGNFGVLLNSGAYTTISAPGAIQNGLYYLFSGSGTQVSGINDNGVIVGSEGDAGFVDSGGTFANISYPGAVFTSPYGINDSGIVSGTAAFASNNVITHDGFLYNTSTNTFTAITYPGATNTIVQGINDSGEVVGFYTLAGQTSGFTYLNGTYASLMYPGSNLTELFGISNNGILSGTYTCASGPCASDPAFFAAPTPNGYSFTTLPNVTPEPGTSVLLGIGLVAFFTVALRRQGRDRRRCFSSRA